MEEKLDAKRWDEFLLLLDEDRIKREKFLRKLKRKGE